MVAKLRFFLKNKTFPEKFQTYQSRYNSIMDPKNPLSFKNNQFMANHILSDSFSHYEDNTSYLVTSPVNTSEVVLFCIITTK
jgi:hypothetical protein